MGSKRKLSKKIIDYILANNPKTKYFYDLFGGGGAISFEALKRPKLKEIHYNELNAGVVKLLEKIRDDGVTDEFYQWIDRDTFHNLKGQDSWLGGLVATCWSFGNDQKGYLYSEDNEKIKKHIHNAIVYKCKESIVEFYIMSGVQIEDSHLRHNTINKRRLCVMNLIKKSVDDRLDMQNLERITRTQHFEGIDNLSMIESLSRIESLSISNKSYNEVEITTPADETIIYLDPPYKDTAKYQKNIDFDKLYEYIRNSPYKIYISGYDMPFEVVEEFEHRSTLSATANNKVIEKLFCNREEIYLDRLF